MNEKEEKELVHRCQSGDAEAWEQLFQIFYEPVGRFLSQLSSDFVRSDVEELSQEVFLSAIRGLKEFHGACALQTWLFRIAINKSRDFVEKKKAAKRGSGQVPVSLNQPDPETGLTLDPPHTGPAPDAALLQQEKYELVGAALLEMGDPCRTIIELRYFGDLSYGEIAITLEMNVKTVSARLSKCLDQLETLYRNKNASDTSGKFSV